MLCTALERNPNDDEGFHLGQFKIKEESNILLVLKEHKSINQRGLSNPPCSTFEWSRKECSIEFARDEITGMRQAIEVEEWSEKQRLENLSNERNNLT